MKKTVTIDEALKKLQEAKEKLGGDACLILSLSDSGISDANVNDIFVIHDNCNRYVEIRVKHPELS